MSIDMRVYGGGMIFSLACLVGQTHAETVLGKIDSSVATGVFAGGGAGNYRTNQAPWTIQLSAEQALSMEDSSAAYAGIAVETQNRSGIGALGGFRLHPSERMRVSIGGVAWLTPYTMYGASAAFGTCSRSSFAVCADVFGQAFFAGSDLPQQSVAMQLGLSLGVSVDAW